MIKANLGLAIALLGMVLMVIPFILAPSATNINPMTWIGLIYVGLGVTFLGARTLDT